MTSLFKNTTEINQKEITSLQKASLNMMFFYIAVPLLLLLGGLCCIFDLEMGIIIIVITSLWAVFFPLLLIIILKNKTKQVLANGKMLNGYTFNENEFQVEVLRGSKENNSEIKMVGSAIINYSQVVKVLETNDYIFLFISKTEAYIVDKLKMVDGSTENLIKFLKLKVFKYVLKVKNKK